MKNTYSIETTITSSQVDSFNKLRFDIILNFFQDLAVAHSNQMGTGFYDLMSKSNAFWVLSKIKFKLNGNIYLNDSVDTITWPNKPSFVKFIRNFNVKSQNAIVEGTSEWCILDATTKSIRRFDDSICYPKDLVHLEDKPSVLPFIKLNEEFCDSDFLYTHKVMFTDLDCNNHTNNVTYSRLALNSFTPDEFNDYNFNSFEIHFNAQSYLYDNIKIYKKVVDNKVYVQGKIEDKQIFNCLFSKV